MDSFETNKVLGALLGALTLFVGVLVFSDILFEDEAPEQPGLIVEVPEDGGTEVAEAVFVTPLPVLLASASVEDGESFVRACASCHNFGAGEPNKVGPALHGVYERQVAALPDFGYSDALQAKSDLPWNFETMDGFLENPRGWAPGTTMGYAGIRRETDRANVLAYLNTLTSTPLPVPTEEEAAVILAEAQAAFEAEQAGGETDLGDGDPLVQDEGDVVLDEAIETQAGIADDSPEVKAVDGALQTPTPPSEIIPVTTGEDIAVEANEDNALTDGDLPDAGDVAVEAEPVMRSNIDGSVEETGAPVLPAVPAQQTVPAITNDAQPGTLANPADVVERGGAEGFSPAAAQPAPAPGVAGSDVTGVPGGPGGQPEMAEDAIEAVSGEPAEVERGAELEPAITPAAPVVVAPAPQGAVAPRAAPRAPQVAPGAPQVAPGEMREVPVQVEILPAEQPRITIIPADPN